MSRCPTSKAATLYRHVRVVIALGPAVCLAALVFMWVQMRASSYVQWHDCDVCVHGDVWIPLAPTSCYHIRETVQVEEVWRERNESELKEQTVIYKRR